MLEVGNNLSGYNIVFSMNIENISTFRSDYALCVNEMHAVTKQFRLFVRLL